jgi:hypothetical protein
MRRILVAVPASFALALVAPGVALAAHHGHRHHGANHSSSRHRHGARARLLRFGSAGAGTGLSASDIAGPQTPGEENAGVVESFEGGVLTIKLADGSLVKGKVTEATRLLCVPAVGTAGPSNGDDQGDGTDSGSGDDQGDGGDESPWSAGDQARASNFESSDEPGQRGDDDEDQPQSCTTEVLRKETPVREAELELSGAGAVWERIVLVHS